MIEYFLVINNRNFVGKIWLLITEIGKEIMPHLGFAFVDFLLLHHYCHNVGLDRVFQLLIGLASNPTAQQVEPLLVSHAGVHFHGVCVGVDFFVGPHYLQVGYDLFLDHDALLVP